MDNKDNNVENNTNPNMEDNGVKIVNNEIELKIDEPKKEEIEVPVEEVKVEKKESKRIIPWVKNEDLMIILLAIIMILVVFNLDNISNLISKKKYKLPSSSDTGETNNPTPVEEDKEIVLSCSKKNDENLYAYDYKFIVNYKKYAYKITYEIKALDSSKLSDEAKEELAKLETSTMAYIDNASSFEGSEIKNNTDGTFTQLIDLTVARKSDINKIEEIMPFNTSDNIGVIQRSLEKNGYTCK